MRKSLTLLVLIVALVLPSPALAQEGESVVRAILFHSPTCGHCKTVIEEVLPPLQEEHGSALEMLLVDSSTEKGSDLYLAMQDAFQPSDERRGVPSLVVGDELLVGSAEIPDLFPDIIKAGLAAGGIEWPALPGLESFIDGVQPEPAAVEEGLDLDAVVAWVTLVVLVVTLVYCGLRVWRYREAWFNAVSPANLHAGPTVIVAVLCVVGLFIAGYLSYIELTQSSTVCGPLGGCDIVQESRFAIFLGIPMGIWGVGAYVFMLGWWWLGEFGAKAPSGVSNMVRWARPALLLYSLFTVLFSIYLTCLEIFVIQATCSWCIGSAVTTAVICWILTQDRAWLPTEIAKKPRRRRKARA